MVVNEGFPREKPPTDVICFSCSKGVALLFDDQLGTMCTAAVLHKYAYLNNILSIGIIYFVVFQEPWTTDCR